MSDLISRSGLLKEIEKYKFGAISNDAEREYIKKTILDFIICQPTANDIDKIIEELEKRTDFLKDCTKYGNENSEQKAKSYSTMMMYEVADLVEDLIEIVKKGRRNEKLKHCPFCGANVAEITNAHDLEDCANFADEICPCENYEAVDCSCFTVLCNMSSGGCGASSGYYATEEKAIAAWNRRVKE